MSDVFEVLIANASGDQPTFEVTWHIFGQTPSGHAKNALIMERRRFIEDAIREKLERERA
jgi:hypothetical protein